MKKIIPFAFLLLSTTVFAQVEKTYPRTISVTGSAEMEIVPDEIYVSVVLKEYDKKGTGKVSLDRIIPAFTSSVRRLGIPDSLVSILTYNSYEDYWEIK